MSIHLDPETEASRLRREFVGDARDFDLPALVREFEIRVDYTSLPGDIEGLSLRMDGCDVIFIDPAYEPETRRRFTLAHEFGHQMLGHSCACSSDAIFGRQNRDPQEQQANGFASSLLMPRQLFRSDIRHMDPCFSDIDPLAERYCVSRTAAAIRYTEITADPCALICFRPPKKPWLVKSKRCEGWWITFGVDDGSPVPQRVRDVTTSHSGEASAKIWIDNYQWRSDWTIQEDVRQVSQDVWLVLLGELPDPDDDPDLEEREADEDLKRRRMSFRRY